jgi:hypothetical protein
MKHLLYMLSAVLALPSLNGQWWSGSAIAQPEELSKKEWRTLRITAGIDPGCTGLEFPNAIFITRKDGLFTIYGVTTDATGHEEFDAGRNISEANLDKALSEAISHFQTAEKEHDTNEYIATLSEKEKEAFYENLRMTNRMPIGGFGGRYICIAIDDERATGNAFASDAMFDVFRSWLHGLSRK